MGILLVGATCLAGDGDLIINGKLGIRSDSPTGIFEVFGLISGSSGSAIPTLTSNTSNGIASESSSWDSDYTAWRTMDGINSNIFCWFSGRQADFPHWLQYQFTSGKIITSYAITSRNVNTEYKPKDWTLQGSNNGTSWTSLDSQSNQSFTTGERKTYSFSNSTSYTHYRLYITAGSGPQYVTIGEFELMESSSPSLTSLFYLDETTGNVGIRSTSPGSYKLNVNGSLYATSYAGSDIRWKKNIQPISNGLSLIERLKGVRFEWRTDEFKDKQFEKGTQIGLIAQEVEPVIPEIVKTDTDGYKAISYEKLTAVLVEAIKEQNQQIKKLEARIKKLEKKKNN